ncbi:SpaA isopeptide-forming pilin-related protein [Bacillus sp. CDB3]|uniref:SpaA isopeptide-forming pilin-related protein n=1 Tax=Bacillus sp. CDB3 TaxID=360310 RepID=UPI0009D8C53F|nr:SpaA isopeptide-forming pilin-related protein [Bacillus sp. CDB3]OQR55782.1 adhesin [Bacillus sp. CDB3]
MKKVFHMFLICLLAFSAIPNLFVQAESSKTGSLTIHKYEQEKGTEPAEEGNGQPGQKVPDGAKPLKGVTFEIKKILSFEKISNDGEIVKEAVKEVKDATPITITTGEDGIVAFKDLELGRYEVKEVAGPAHVNLNKNTYTVDIPMTNKDGKVLNYDVHIYPKNETKRGAVELIKIGDQGKALKGAEFSLFKKDGTVVKTGLVTGTDGAIRVQGLEYGEYYFQETKAPDGYVLIKKTYEFKITESGTISEDGAIKSGKVEGVKVKNELEPTIDKKINGELEKLAINPKTDFNYDVKTLIPEDITTYKKYVVTDNLDGRLVIQGKPIVKIDGKEVDSSVVEVAVDGQKVTATVKNFAELVGKKELHLQIKAQIKEGVETGVEIPNKAKIDFINNEDVTGEKETKPVIVTPTTGGITLKKVETGTNKVLEGAEFELRDKDGKVVVVEGKEVKGVSDKNGVITWNNIPYGEYQIVETKAPTYKKEDGTTGSYQLLRDPIQVKINADQQTIKLTVENNKNGWIIPATGGMGTILFTVVGLGLMLMAAFVFFRRKAVK